MLVMIDVGNTNITVGILSDKKLIASFRLTTSQKRTSDEFAAVFYGLFKGEEVDPKDVEAVIISTVVPKMTHSLRNSIYKFFDLEPMIIGPGIKTGIVVKTENPRETGSDRIVNLVAAKHLYGGPAIVIDFGTATTYDYLNENDEFEFGLIAPGIETSAMSLWQKAAKLPEISIKKPPSIKCKNTISSMQGGLVFGYIGQTEYIVNEFRKETGENAKVIASGGLGRIIYEASDIIDVYDPALAFKGMHVIYEKNKEKS